MKGNTLCRELVNGFLDIFHDQAEVVDAVSLRPRCSVLDCFRKDLEILVVGDPQIDKPDASVFAMEPEHFR